MSKELSRIADPDDIDLDDCIPAYLILFDKRVKMYRCYHADISDLVVLDEDPLKGLKSLIDILEKDVNYAQHTEYN